MSDDKTTLPPAAPTPAPAAPTTTTVQPAMVPVPKFDLTNAEGHKTDMMSQAHDKEIE